MTDPDETLAQVKQMIAPLRKRLFDRDMHPERTAVWLARTVPSEYHSEILTKGAAAHNSTRPCFFEAPKPRRLPALPSTDTAVRRPGPAP